MEDRDRRAFLGAIGTGVAGSIGLSGCSTPSTTDGSPTDGESSTASEAPTTSDPSTTAGNVAVYENPVGPIGFGDVSIIDDGEHYYAYGTETPNDIVPIARSTNMYEWEYIAPALEEYPDWRDEPDAGVWAPDIVRWNDQYHLYYSYSTWGSQNNPGIGLATADTPEGPFTDQGPVFRAEDLGMTNGIDSEFVAVDGEPWMVWGSWYGIHGVKLTPDGTDYVDGTEFQLAGDMREGGMIVQANDYYYLFYSTGHCCDGYESTYELEVGRAESFTGPYYNQDGEDLRDLNQHRSGVAILEGDSYFTGPGHNDAYQDENGDWWLFYHVEATTDDETRYMMLDRIQWDDGWPVVACTGTPSKRSPVPHGEYDCALVAHHDDNAE